jgi:hypothetical protein
LKKKNINLKKKKRNKINMKKNKNFLKSKSIYNLQTHFNCVNRKQNKTEEKINFENIWNEKNLELNPQIESVESFDLLNHGKK